MKVKYFEDTDTAYVELLDKPVFETREISENILIDVDEKGNLVSMTIEHAKENMRLCRRKHLHANRGHHRCDLHHA